MKEQIIEEGIVIKTEKGFAEIALINSDDCEECHAKMFCKPSETKDMKTITAVDPLGVIPGQEVTIAVEGATLLKASMSIYGLPLLILVLGIVLGSGIFKSTQMPELYAFLLGFGLMSLYYALFYLIGKIAGRKIVNVPKIIRVKQKQKIDIFLN